MSKKALFIGFDKRAAEAEAKAGAKPVVEEVAEPAPGSVEGAPQAPEKLLKWNPSGGVDPRTPEEMTTAQTVDLVTLPEGVEGSNCGNCQFFRMLDKGLGTGFCTHPEVKLDVTNRMKCTRWNAPDTYRAWEAADPSAVPDPSIMGEAGAMQAGELPIDAGAGAVDPATGQPVDPAAAGAPGAPGAEGADPAAAGGAPAAKPKPKKKPEKKEDGKEGGGGTNVHVHVGGGGEKEKGQEKKAFWKGFDV